jgi:hypothetical protein
VLGGHHLLVFSVHPVPELEHVARVEAVDEGLGREVDVGDDARLGGAEREEVVREQIVGLHREQERGEDAVVAHEPPVALGQTWQEGSLAPRAPLGDRLEALVDLHGAHHEGAAQVAAARAHGRGARLERGVHVREVVRLLKVLDQELPVGEHRVLDAPRPTQGPELERVERGRAGREGLVERRRVVVEAHEDEALPGLDAHPQERGRLGARAVAELGDRRGRARLEGEVPREAVVGAAQHADLARRRAREGRAPMWADVAECRKLALAVTQHDHPLGGERHDHEAAHLGQLFFAARRAPQRGQEVASLPRVHLGLGEGARGEREARAQHLTRELDGRALEVLLQPSGRGAHGVTKRAYT